jgi:hypothetical protein
MAFFVGLSLSASILLILLPEGGLGGGGGARGAEKVFFSYGCWE